MLPITLIIPKNRYNYHKYILFLSKFQDTFNFRILSWDPNSSFQDSDFYGQFAIILNRYCYIDFMKLNKLLNSIKKYELCSVPNHYQNLFILKLETIKDCKSISDININIASLCTKHKIYNLQKYCYMTNIGIVGGLYHKAIFVCLNDNDDNFDYWLNEFHTKSKKIYYKGKPYELKIGKNFFIQKFTHIGILPDKKIVYWDNKKKDWQLANKKISQLLTNKG